MRSSSRRPSNLGSATNVASEGLMSHRRLSSEPTKFPKCSARLSKSAQVFRSSNGEVCWSHPPERALSHKWWHELDTWQANVTWCLARWFHVACLQKWQGPLLLDLRSFPNLPIYGPWPLSSHCPAGTSWSWHAPAEVPPYLCGLRIAARRV